MLTYATGRVLTAGDRGEIERIVNALRPHGYRLRDLIHLVAESPLLVAPPPTAGEPEGEGGTSASRPRPRLSPPPSSGRFKGPPHKGWHVQRWLAPMKVNQWR